MICNRMDDGWEIIYQRAHALLAAMAVEHWRRDQRTPRWFETLNAIAQHDNGWQEWESGTRLHANGEPIHFRDTPPGDAIAQGARAVLRARHQSLWAGLIVSRHISNLLDPHRGKLGELDALIDEQIALRAQWQEWLHLTTPEIEHEYSFLKFGDEISLMLCCRTLDQRDSHEVATVAGITYTAHRGADDTIGLDPWPYACESVRVGADIYRVHQKTFASDDELSDLLLTTRPSYRTWRLIPPA
jgi:hypothetical protein